MKSGVFGAGGVIRTHDLLITNQLLYLLSYTSEYAAFRREKNCSTKKPRRQHRREIFYRGLCPPENTPSLVAIIQIVFPTVFLQKSPTKLYSFFLFPTESAPVFLSKN